MPVQTKRRIQGYGWKRDLPDIRDARRARPAITHLPDKVDLSTSAHQPALYDQANLGSCTAHGVKGVIEYANHKQLGKFLDPSRLFIYYGERVIEDSVDQDSGAQIRDGMTVVAKAGVPPESAWPYDVTTFTTPPVPFDQLEEQAHNYDLVVKYERVVQGEFTLKEALSSDLPVVFGFSVYSAFESADVAKSAIVPMPDPADETVGGHCTVLVGYDDATGRFKVRNSWGPDWGDGGYFYMPYGYVTNPDLASDFWVVELVQAAA